MSGRGRAVRNRGVSGTYKVDTSFNLAAISAGISSADIGNWTDFASADRLIRPNTSVYSLTNVNQPGGRIYYISQAGTDSLNSAVSDYYYFNGTNIIDSSGSTTGTGGVLYGTDPINPSGPIKTFKTWHYVAPRSFGQGIGYGSEIPGASTFAPGFNALTNRFTKGDWWLFNRGDTFDIEAMAALFVAGGGTATANSSSSLSIPGCQLDGAGVQTIGSYGSLSLPQARFIQPVTGFIFRLSDTDGTQAVLKNFQYFSLWFDGHDRSRSGLDGGGVRFAAAFFGGKNDVNNKNGLFEDIRSDATGGFIAGASFLYRRMNIGDHFLANWASSGGTTTLAAGTTNYTLLSSDLGKSIDCYNNSALVITWPPGLPKKYTIRIRKLGTGTVQLVPDTANGVVFKNTKNISVPSGFNVTTITDFGFQIAGVPANTFMQLGGQSHCQGFGLGGNDTRSTFRMEDSLVFNSGWVRLGGDPTSFGPGEILVSDFDIFSRNTYLSTKLNSRTSGIFRSGFVKGASGEQRRGGGWDESNFYVTGYVTSNGKGGYGDARSTAYIRNNVIQLFTAEPAHPGWGWLIGHGAQGVEMTGNIISASQQGRVSRSFAVQFKGINDDYGYSIHHATQFNRIHSNIFDVIGSTTVVDIKDSGRIPGDVSGSANDIRYQYAAPIVGLEYNFPSFFRTQGTVVTCVPAAGTYTGTPTYQWYLNGAVIAGATQQNYTLQAADVVISSGINQPQVSCSVSGITYNVPVNLIQNKVQNNILAFNGSGPNSVVTLTGGALQDTVITNNTTYSTISSFAAALGASDIDWTLKKYLQSQGITVTSIDGCDELMVLWRAMRKGNWQYRWTPVAIVNSFRVNHGLPALYQPKK